VTVYAVSYEIDQPGGPLTWHVEGTEEEADALQAFMEDHLEAWQEPQVYPLPTKLRTIESLKREFIEDWDIEEDDDGTADPAG
jgi:hypothetical protein